MDQMERDLHGKLNEVVDLFRTKGDFLAGTLTMHYKEKQLPAYHKSKRALTNALGIP